MFLGKTSFVVLAVLALVRPAIAQDTPGAGPQYPDDFVGGADFFTTAGEKPAGAASVIKVKGSDQAYILSSRLLLGPLGGFSQQTMAADLPTFVQGIKIAAFRGGTHFYGVVPLLIQSKRLDPVGGEPIDDLALYKLKDSSPQDQAVQLAGQLPAVGDTVYLIAHVRGGVPENQRVQPMTVYDTRRWLECRFNNDQIITSGASGAPVLNAAGECLGVYSGHLFKEGHIYGFIVPAPLIASVIDALP